MTKGLWQLMDKATRAMTGMLGIYWCIGLLVAFPILLAALMFFALCFPLAIIARLLQPEQERHQPATQPPAVLEKRNYTLTKADKRFLRALDTI